MAFEEEEETISFWCTCEGIPEEDNTEGAYFIEELGYEWQTHPCPNCGRIWEGVRRKGKLTPLLVGCKRSNTHTIMCVK